MYKLHVVLASNSVFERYPLRIRWFVKVRLTATVYRTY